MHLLIRADASAQIGTGHVMRCLALAQAWMQHDGRAILMTETSPWLKSRLISEKIQILHLKSIAGSREDAWETVQAAQRVEATWVVVDGYQFNAEYQCIFKEHGLQLLVLDDYGHAKHYWADIVLNQNISANISLYANREPYTQLLLGPRFALLRREFWDWQGWQRQTPEVARKILVTLGGADPDNVTLKVIQTLQQVQIDDLQIVAVVGASNPHIEALKEAVQNSRHSIRLERNVTNMPELMAWADIAIAGGGSTCWELTFMGLPALVIILAENQRAIAETLDQAGIAQAIGWSASQTAETIAREILKVLLSKQIQTRMTQLGQALVDGQGSDRVLMILKGKTLRLRQVHPEDCELLWKWANDSEVRAYSFSTESIPWDTHKLWFSKQLKDSSHHLFIGINKEDEPIGQVRFDTWDNEHAEISISLDCNHRGQGYGTVLINLGIEELLRQIHIQAIHARIKPHNLASCKVFEKAQFKRLTEEVIKGHPALHYLRII
ncbi:MAG: UDP-2,4-diacetamido-2,4,6-trideoxy-beta-L-altropyranose hydrolase [Acaryochloris sp. RU_4_1]|nr:UDP-2,4-diacetamido-2,4,6-trideoxy-beta-L-altropyranose hydrolase [Acaryochloris sp. RU_4_1]NJR53990.1 UDP-2,4-diacetamido-2,4,6-trideoxy-beta-L-altropyranose hydrolase [Acaryochloris sp. CRU_2_0]